MSEMRPLFPFFLSLLHIPISTAEWRGLEFWSILWSDGKAIDFLFARPKAKSVKENTMAEREKDERYNLFYYICYHQNV